MMGGFYFKWNKKKSVCKYFPGPLNNRKRRRIGYRWTLFPGIIQNKYCSFLWLFEADKLI